MDGDRFDVFDDDGGRPRDSGERHSPSARDTVEPATSEQAAGALRAARPLLAELLWERAQARVAMSPALSATLEAALRAWDAGAASRGEDARRAQLATIDQVESALSDVLEALQALDPAHAELCRRVRRTRDGLHEAGNLVAHGSEPARDVLGLPRRQLNG